METEPVRAPRISSYRTAWFVVGVIAGWVAHEIYVAYKLAELGLL